MVRCSATTSEGRRNCDDIIWRRSVDALVNTISGGRVPDRDSFQIRRAVVQRRFAWDTSLDTARAAVKALMNGAARSNVLPHREYLESSLILTEGEDAADAALDVALPSAKEEAR